MGDDSLEYLTDLDQIFEAEDEAARPAKRYRGKAREWQWEREFETRREALEFLVGEKCWSVCASYSSKEGDKVQYRCNAVARAGSQCPAAVYLLYHAETETVSLFRTGDAHDHGGRKASRGLDPKIREAVEELFETGVSTPKAILTALRRKSVPLPPIQQLQNFLVAYKTKTKARGSGQMNIGDFEAWCSLRTDPSPNEPNKAFVVAYETGLANDSGSTTIKVFMSTPRLLKIATRTNVVHADGTYKLNWEGLPTLVIGTTDLDCHFHPIGVGVFSGETAQDFEFAFRAVVSGVQRLYGVSYSPSVLVADAAEAISNGFAAVFGPSFQRVIRWFHVEKALEAKLSCILNAGSRQRLKHDIEVLQLCESEQIFDSVVPLFFTKWNGSGDATIDTFLEYFHREWIIKRKGWFEGYALDTPSTNNALEATNARIKSDHTLRRRLPLPRFLTLLQNEILYYWSLDRDPTSVDCKLFADVPTKSTAVWTKAFQWASLSKQVLSKPCAGGWRLYFVPAGGNTLITPAMVNEYNMSFENLHWPSFEHYATMRSSLWVVSIFGNQWEHARCNCPVFLKKCLCKHSLGIAIRKGLAPVPRVALSVPQKRKRGRPPKATPAL